MHEKPSGHSRPVHGGSDQIFPKPETYRPLPNMTNGRLFYTHLLLPLAVFGLLITLLALLHVDWKLAQALYAWQGDHWALRKGFFTETLVHKLGHDLSIAAWVIVLTAWIVSFKRSSMRAWRKPLGYLLLSVLASTLLVAWIKSWSNMDCPWDIEGLGGTRPYITLLSTRPDWLPHNKCFPAGHASGGFSWMALYFFFLMTRPTLRWYGLAAGMGVGLLYGISQQLRGAHFVSHDLWTAMICWTVAYGMYSLFRPKSDLPAGPAAS
jgi:membrane-associated PAP2 superfamily phosphatase